MQQTKTKWIKYDEWQRRIQLTSRWKVYRFSKQIKAEIHNHWFTPSVYHNSC